MKDGYAEKELTYRRLVSLVGNRSATPAAIVPLTTWFTGIEGEGVLPSVSASATSDGATIAVTGLVGLGTGIVAGNTKGVG